MTNSIKIGLTVLSAMTCLSGIARAEEMRINIAGKSPQMVHAEIVRAARAVCSQTAISAELFEPLNAQAQCIDDTVEKAQADYSKAISTTMTMAQQSGVAGLR